MTNSTQTRRMFIFVAFLFAMMVHSANAQDIREFRGRTMGTTYMVKIFGAEDVSDDVRLAIDRELREVNDQMSTYLKSSELSRFNASDSTDWFDVSADTAAVVQFAQELAVKTDGAFDVTVGLLVNAWGFGPDGRTETRPDDATLEQLRQTIGYKKLSVRLDPPGIRKSTPGLNVDLSSIAKGHAVDRVVELLATFGAEDAFVEIGGEVRTSGGKAGQPWKVGIQLPDTQQTAAMIAHSMGSGPMGSGQGEDESMATSGDYRNFFRSGGKRYSHTIDPRTAEPVDHDLASVSVVTTSCMAADAWATAINVLGPTEGLRLATEEQLNVFLITRTENSYEMNGIGTLAQYATENVAAPMAAAVPAAAAAPAEGSGMFATAVITAIAFAVVLCAMAIGVMFGQKSISGSCGGLANKTAEDGSVSCSLCSSPADACKELREKMNQAEG